jgi:two-component system CheB/CheR fusion protein
MAEDLQRARCAAEAASQAKSQFLANVSHEIRTPLTAILGFSDLIALPRCSSANRRKHVETIRENAEILVQLIDDILDLSRVEAGKIDFRPEECSLRHLIEPVVQLLRPRAQHKKLKLTVRYQRGLSKVVWFDPVRFRQILINLVGNAIKFTEKGGVRIAVTSASDGPVAKLHVAVRDTGVGIKLPSQPRDSMAADWGWQFRSGWQS